MDYYELGQRIRAARKAKGWSQEQLAERVNISVTHMSHIETGNTKLSIEVFYDIAKSLGTRSDELLFGDKDRADAAKQDIISVTDSCTPAELSIICDTVKALKSSLSRNIR